MLRILILFLVIKSSIFVSGTKTSFACEHDHAKLECMSGEIIKIISANYGRTKPGHKVCAYNGVDTFTNCKAGSSLNKVRNACHHKQSCSIHASNSVFGDPCYGTYKYLEVQYECITTSSKSQGNKKVLACEHKEAKLSCGPKEEITVLAANYGRTKTGRHTCPMKGVDKVTTCISESSFNRLSQLCNGEHGCTVPAHNSVFGDPCYGTFKYLEVEYKCAPSVNVVPGAKTAVACEHKNMDIKCENGEVIDVMSANYGRTRNGNHVCPSQGIDHVTSCRAQSSFDTVAALCNNKESCTLAADNSVYGDPCPGIFKYLEVQYNCKPAPTVPGIKQNIACEHSVLNVECPKGAHIKVLSAKYGRSQARDVCPKPGIDQVTSCVAASSFDKVSQLCDNKESCSIVAENSVFGDPCVGTWKYLEVINTCIENDEEKQPSIKVPTNEKIQVCEEEEVKLKCDPHEEIRIVSAHFGRTGKHLCGITKDEEPSYCVMSSAVDTMTSLCNGHQLCSVKASTSVFGDPCNHKTKYLEVEYVCVQTQISWGNGKTITACESSHANMECAVGDVIEVTSANYGRTLPGSQICPSEGSDYITTCKADTSLYMARKLCNNKQSCAISASNAVFGDPCLGTYKYLELEYKCKPQDLEDQGDDGSVICEHNSRTLSCPDGKMIDILYANYGRTSHEYCQSEGADTETDCKTPYSMDLVKEECNGKQSCTLSASNSVFGDPCVGTVKYLDVQYICRSIIDIRR